MDFVLVYLTSYHTNKTELSEILTRAIHFNPTKPLPNLQVSKGGT